MRADHVGNAAPAGGAASEVHLGHPEAVDVDKVRSFRQDFIQATLKSRGKAQSKSGDTASRTKHTPDTRIHGIEFPLPPASHDCNPGAARQRAAQVADRSRHPGAGAVRGADNVNDVQWGHGGKIVWSAAACRRFCSRGLPRRTGWSYCVSFSVPAGGASPASQSATKVAHSKLFFDIRGNSRIWVSWGEMPKPVE